MVEAQSASASQPSGLPLVLGVTQVFHDKLQFAPHDRWIGGRQIFLDRSDRFVGMLPPVQEALDGRQATNARTSSGSLLIRSCVDDDAV